MTKSELVEMIAKRSGLTLRASLQATNAILNAISGALARGDKVAILGFGTFDVATRKARKARDPRTGQIINVPSPKVPRFRAGTELKKRVTRSTITIIEEYGPSTGVKIGLKASGPREKRKKTLGIEKSRKIFIVHGHDYRLREQLELFLRSLEFKPIILDRRANKGTILIEKLEKNIDKVGYAFVLLTPDDVCSARRKTRKKEYRARQNVIFELGYLMGKLGRKNICCLYDKRDKRGERVTLPSDILGLVYKEITSTLKEIELYLVKELQAVGYEVVLERD